MSKITAVFCDVGGVLGTNGLDQGQRKRLVETFAIDLTDFEDRHHMLSTALDDGKFDLDQYLDRTIFYRARPFDKEAVRRFIYNESQAFPDSIALIACLAKAGKVFMATLNNESRELNHYRIEKFSLRKYFSVFYSSCYLGVSKPHAEIYQLALDLSQRRAEECVFIDDRALNVESAQLVGLNTIEFVTARQTEAALRALGLEF